MNVPASAHPPTAFVITHEFFPRRGGIATFTEEVVRAAAGLGHEIEVWAQAAPREADTTQRWPFRLRRMPLRGNHGWACQLAVARELIAHRRRLRHATVWLPEPGPMLALMQLQFVRAFRPRRLLLTFHGSEILRFHGRPLTRRLALGLINHATAVSVLSDYTGRLLTERFPEAKNKLLLTPGAPRADFAAVARNAIARATRTRVCVLTVGRLHPRKGQLETLEALLALSPAARARVEYWIAGSAVRPDYEQRLRHAATHADFPVKFFGDLPDADLAALYAQADVFALTSVEHGHSVEGFGLVYLEAAAHGLPAVAHATGGVSEAVLDGETGLLVPPGQPARLTEAFTRLLNDPALRHRLGEAARAHAARHTWSRAADLLFGPVPPKIPAS
jgi:phosphatidylinositol alpha-1,6-mannosyltransferase